MQRNVPVSMKEWRRGLSKRPIVGEYLNAYTPIFRLVYRAYRVLLDW